MLQPRKQKYRKQFRGKRRGVATRGNEIEFGEYGVQALECVWMSARQIESARKAIAGHTKRKGKYWIRVFPDKPVTKKPAEVRMGKGKGAVDHFVSVVKPGRIIFEVGGVPEDVAIGALQRAAQKLPIKTRILRKDEIL